MSHCITDLHLELPPATVRFVNGGWVVRCECGQRSPFMALLSEALQFNNTHAATHRINPADYREAS